MFTNSEQTTKLIELGFSRPNSSVECELPKGDWRIGAVGIRKAYSIGELIELIPPIFTNKYKCDCYLNITHDSANWIVDYTVSGVERPYIIVGEIEFIDAIFAMILKLYETGFYDFETKRYIY